MNQNQELKSYTQYSRSIKKKLLTQTIVNFFLSKLNTFHSPIKKSESKMNS